jgi:hypothetical protein
MRGQEAQRLNFEDEVNEDHVEARIARLESDVEYIKKDVGQLRVDMNAANASLAIIRDTVNQLKAVFPTLATQAEVGEIAAVIPTLATKAAVGEIAAVIPHLATKADLHELRTLIVAQEAKFLRWFVGAVVTVAALAFSIARFVH